MRLKEKLANKTAGKNQTVTTPAKAPTVGASTPAPSVVPSSEVTLTGTRPTLFWGQGGKDNPQIPEATKYLQGILKREDFLTSNAAIDGNYTIGTESAVKEFQILNNLKADGVVGPITWAAIERLEARVHQLETKVNELSLNNPGSGETTLIEAAPFNQDNPSGSGFTPEFDFPDPFLNDDDEEESPLLGLLDQLDEDEEEDNNLGIQTPASFPDPPGASRPGL
ncbi:MAG: peptidoglycan-binding protein, partial [Synechococcaceae cyanobacterium RL_1_2]|nr:peptidoglycan-binding protein [Synechococcaceae cyanobacterium RL_1_2]